MGNASDLNRPPRARADWRLRGVAYWSLLLVAALGLAALDAHPVKLAGLIGASAAAWYAGVALAPFHVAAAVVLPEAGSPFPAILSLPDLLFWPLLLKGALFGRSNRTSLVRVAALAVALAGAWAFVVGVVLRGVDAKPAWFTLYQQIAHLGAIWIASRAARTPGGARRLLIGLLAGCSLAAVAGLAQVFGGEPVVVLQQRISETVAYPAYGFGYVGQYLWWGVRKAFAGFYSPNGLGAALMFGLLLAVGGALRSRSKAYAVVAIVLGCGLLATFSRGALLAAAAVLATLAWRTLGEGRRRTALILLASALVLPAAYVLLLESSTRAAVSDAIAGSGGLEVAAPLKRRSAEMKIDEVRNVIAMWREGVGLAGAGYGVVYDADRGFEAAPHGIEISPAYAELVFRSGLVGVGALIAAAWALGQLWRARAPLGPRGHPVKPALLGALIHSAIDHPFLTVPGLVVVFWTAWALLEAPET